MTTGLARGSLVTALLCLAGIGAPSQIRTETRVVLVDTIVTDKQGEYVHDLTARDFRLWEDNKEQAIKSVTLEQGLDAAASKQRYLVLFFAGMEASERLAARQAVSGFIDANAHENRLMAVVSYNDGLRIRQNFTGDAARLKSAVSGAISSEGVSGAADSGALDTIRGLGSLARNLGALPGRKTIVFVSDGLSQSSVQKAELATAIDACNKSDVAVYPIDVRPLSSGLKPRPTSPFDTELSADLGRAARRGGQGDAQGDQIDSDPRLQGAAIPDQQLLFRLASGTGGFVISNASELQPGLQKVGGEQNEYYLLSYTPSESKEGSCHTLRVKVDRGGTTVRARAGYCESKPQDLLAGTIAGQDLERRAAGTPAGGIDASMRLSYFYLSPNVARVNLAMEIPADALKFENRKGKPDASHAEINFLGIASAPDGGVGARFSDTLKLDPDSKGKSLHYEKEFKIFPGRYTFTLAFSSGGESFGKLEAPLTIDSRQEGELAMSGLALSKEAHPAAELGLNLAGLAENITPLVTDDVQIVPSGSSQFTKSDAGFFYFEVYAHDPAPLRVDVRVLDRKTGEVTSDSGLLKLNLPKNSRTDTIPAGSRLPIDKLAPGTYELEVTAVDAAGKQIKRTADFEVKQIAGR
jgi:VWFA-related protein